MLQATPQSPMVSQSSTPRVPYANAGPYLGDSSSCSSGRASREGSGSERLSPHSVNALGVGLGMR